MSSEIVRRTPDADGLAFDVVIAGAGITGATLALALAGAGFSVAVVDPIPVESRVAAEFDGRASAIAYANFRQWRVLGLAEALLLHAQAIYKMVITDSSSPGASARPPSRAFLGFNADEIADRTQGEPLGWMIENRRLRATLTGALEISGVRVFAPTSLETLEDQDGPEATVQLGDQRRLRARLVVGADGGGSKVRQTAGLGVQGWTYSQCGIVATVVLAEPHRGIARQCFLPGGPLAILPLTEDRASLVWTERPEHARALAAGSPDAFEGYLARRFADEMGDARLLGPRLVFPLRLQTAEALVARRVALVGDAAHLIHPIAGQGLNLGLKDVAALAEVLVDARRLGEDIGSPGVLARYTRWRRFDAAAVMTTTDLLTRLFSNDVPVLRAVRGAGLSLVNNISAVRRLCMREAGGDLGDLPRLLRGEPL